MKTPVSPMAWWHVCVILALGKSKWENEEFKVILSYKASLRPAWHNTRLYQNKLKKVRTVPCNRHWVYGICKAICKALYLVCLYEIFKAQFKMNDNSFSSFYFYFFKERKVYCLYCKGAAGWELTRVLPAATMCISMYKILLTGEIKQMYYLWNIIGNFFSTQLNFLPYILQTDAIGDVVA